jgi:type II secretory pathway component PulJ
MRRTGFTLLELMLASTLSVLLIAGVLFALASLSRDARAAVAKKPASDLKATLELLQWDLTNARSVSQSSDHRTLVLEGHGAIAPETLRPNGRLARVVYSCQLRGNVWRLTRNQQYLDDPARPQNSNNLVGTGISSIEVLPVGGLENEPQKMPQWVRVRVYGPGAAVEKQICIR